MHTVVIQMQDQPQDWHLVEPFFYKGRSSGQLSFFKIDKTDHYDQLYVDINRHLSQERISQWQVIVVMYVPTISHGQISITNQFKLFSKNVLTPFSDQEFNPDNIIFVVLDPLKRNTSNAPEDNGAHSFWQIDNFGYYPISEKLLFAHNMFVQEELEQLDEVWGNGIDLKKAGLLEKPDPAYYEMIIEKKKRVLETLKSFVEEKKQFAINSSDGSDPEFLTVGMLEDIYELFEKRLEKLIEPPLSQSLITYSPSQQLANILKEKNSLLSVIENMKLVRQDFLGYTVEKRTNALISVALFISQLASDKELVNQIPKGTISELKALINKEKLSDMLTNYYSCLKAAKMKIESKIFERQSVKKNKFEDVKAPPYSAGSLEDEDIKPIQFKMQKRLTFMDEWQNDVDHVSNLIEANQHKIIEQAKSGWRSLDINKRSKLNAVGEEVEIHDYLEGLKDKVQRLYIELGELEPGGDKEQSKWKRFIEKKGFDLNFFVKACPTTFQAVLGFLIVFLFLLGPHLYTLNWQSQHFRDHWLDYTIIPLVFTGAILLVCLILKRSMEKPIKQILESVRNRRGHLFEQQKVTQSKYNHYLNKLYELYRVRQQYLSVKQQYEIEKRQNYYYRYHQSRIDEFIDSCEHFMSQLGLMKMTDEKRFNEFFEAKFAPHKDVVENPIYSPLDCHSAKIEDTFQPKLIKDQVYPL